MKIRTIAFLCALVISALAVTAYGAHIKYNILEPLGLEDDHSIVELPFVLMSDETLQFMIEFMQAEQAGPTDPEPTDPEPTDPKPTNPEPTDPKPTDPKPTEPEPTEPKPTEPEPTDPRPTGPKPTEPEPTEPEPTDPGPTEPEPTEPEPTEPEPTEPEPTEPEPTEPEPTEPEPTEPEPTEPEPTEPEPTEPVENTPYIPPISSNTYPDYDFSQGAVSQDWYDKALFIGDSRTVGLRDYARAGNADYFCSVGANVFNITTQSCSDTNFSKQTLESLLSGRTYDKIFIGLGINECGYSHSTVIAAYQKLIKLIRKYQPDADIILQGVMMVTRGYAGSRSHFKPDNINALNRKIAALADGTSIYYIDVNEYFTNSSGYLYDDLTGDGCHLYAKCDQIWQDWISYAVARLEI